MLIRYFLGEVMNHFLYFYLCAMLLLKAVVAHRRFLRSEGRTIM